MNLDSDVLVVGGGPAGNAAAISAAQSGLRVVLLDVRTRPDQRPGETLHPAAETLFRKLGVDRAINSVVTIRHMGHWVDREKRLSLVRFGGGQFEPWRGFQIRRTYLDEILSRRASDVGALIKTARAIKPVFSGSRIIGVQSSQGFVACKLLIDASGTSHWLARARKEQMRILSPPLTAWYGWAASEQSCRFAEPLLTIENGGWSWIAQIGPRLCAWARLNFLKERTKRLKKPSLLDDFKELEHERGADVTWRMPADQAGDGFFYAGDAGGVIDPAASHGVLRALLTGIAAAQCSVRILKFGRDAPSESVAYSRWFGGMVVRDAAILRRLYQGKISISSSEPILGPARTGPSAN
jgi:flavin-dependent dehydrogenase